MAFALICVTTAARLRARLMIDTAGDSSGLD
jgi:hypothetical protein